MTKLNYFLLATTLFFSTVLIYSCKDDETPIEICNNNIDDDGDGDIDCQDNDCVDEDVCDTDGDGVNDDVDDCPDYAGTEANGCDATETSCDDNLDNDGDGNTDCEDSDCGVSDDCVPDSDGDGVNDSLDNCINYAGTEANGCDVTETFCDDNIDNDGDGSIDCDDSDCNGVTACDSDGDGVNDDIDDCPNYAGTESNGCDATETICDDGIDNDGDAAIDCKDGDCPLNTDIFFDGTYYPCEVGYGAYTTGIVLTNSTTLELDNLGDWGFAPAYLALNPDVTVATITISGLTGRSTGAGVEEEWVGDGVYDGCTGEFQLTYSTQLTNGAPIIGEAVTVFRKTDFGNDCSTFERTYIPNKVFTKKDKAQAASIIIGE